MNIDDCPGHDCSEHSTCVDLVNDYVCECDQGYEGEQCDINPDNCASNPCQNDGTCVDSDGYYVCVCVFGYTGGVALDPVLSSYLFP